MRKASALDFACVVVMLAAAVLACRPMGPDGVPWSKGEDIANHVRHVHEYQLAIREGQLPPLIAPTLNANTRAPLFQYYGGTAYVIPGLFALVGIDAYRALGLGIGVHVLAAGLGMFAACRRLGLGRRPALAAAVAMQLAPFAGSDLYNRGGYPEFAAQAAFPLVFYCLVRLVRPRPAEPPAPVFSGPRDTFRDVCLAGLAWAYFIPLHPIQTVMCAALAMGLLFGHALLDLRRPWPAILTLPASLLLGLLATAWFWYPIVRDYRLLRIVPHETFLDAGLSNLRMLLWPAFREDKFWEWAPQMGFAFAGAAVVLLLAAVAALVRRVGIGKPRPANPTRFLGVLAALSIVAIVGVIGWYDRFTWVRDLLKPLQWSYRLLIPAAVAGALAVGLVLDALERREQETRRGFAREAFGALVAYLFLIAIPYYAEPGKYPRVPLETGVLSPGFVAPNSYSYALRGTSLADLHWDAGGGRLRAGEEIELPREGYPFTARLTLRKPAPDADISVNRHNPAAGGDPTPVEKTSPDADHVVLTIPLKPRVGHLPGDERVRFDVTPPGSAWAIEGLAMRVADDGPDAEWIHQAPEMRRRQSGRRTRMAITVPPGGAGLYQLPVCHLPTNEIRVNDETVPPASTDRFMTVVRLKEGLNAVTIRSAPTWPAVWLAAGTLAVLVAGGLRRRRAPKADAPMPAAG